jgi:hypothetical protein
MTWLRRVVLGTLITWCAGFGTAHASSIVFSDFGPGDTFDSNGYGVTSPAFIKSDVAATFTPSSSYTFDYVRVAASLGFGGATEFDIALAADDSGHPGTVLESFALTLTNSPGVLTGTSVLHPLLAASTPYWIVASVPVNPPEFADWWDNSIGAKGLLGVRPSSGVWFVNANSTLPAFDIGGTAAASAVPEPATWLLVSVGVVGFRARRRRRSVRN